MILPVSDINIESSSSLKSFEFSIDTENQGLIMEMFRKKIYEDPISSIIREIGTNARDANRENNRADVPVEFIFHTENKLVNNSNLKLEIKDSGIGISPDRMENVFVKYTNSTKTNSNNYTGGFGIGAKTPFAYKDIFNIITINDNIKYYYVAYIDETKKGKVDLQDTEKTDEPSGTSIIIPIDKNDEQAFIKAIIYYTSFWSVKPIINNNINVTDLVNLIETDDFIIYFDKNNFYTHNQKFVLIDEIPYILKTNKDIIYQESVNNYFNNKLCLKFKNGELDISINRETLQYSDRTLEVLNNKFKAIYDYLFKNINDYLINNSKTYLDACINFENINSFNNNKPQHLTFAYKWLKANSTVIFNYNGLELISEVTFKTKKLYKLDDYDGIFEFEKLKASHISNCVFYLIERYNSHKINYLRDLHLNQTIVLVKNITEDRYRKTYRYYSSNDFQSNRIGEENYIKLFNIEITDLDSVIIPKEEKIKFKTVREKTEFTKIRIRQAFRTYNGAKYLEINKKTKTTKYDKTYIYFPLKSVTDYYSIGEYERKILDYYSYFNKFDTTYEFIIINKNNENDFFGFNNIISFKDVEEKLKLKLKGINKLLMYKSINNYNKNNFGNKIIISKKLNSKFDKIRNKLLKLKTQNYDLYTILNNTDENTFSRIKGNSNKQLTNIRKKMLTFQDNYPLLKRISKSDYKYYYKEINEYIELINNKKN